MQSIASLQNLQTVHWVTVNHSDEFVERKFSALTDNDPLAVLDEIGHVEATRLEVNFLTTKWPGTELQMCYFLYKFNLCLHFVKFLQY